MLTELAARVVESAAFNLPDSAGEDVDENLLEKLEQDAVVGKAIRLFRHRIAADWYWQTDDDAAREALPVFDALIDECHNFPQARMAACNVLLEGRGALRMVTDTVRRRMPGDVEERDWTVVRHLVPIGQPQLELGWDLKEYVDDNGEKFTRRVTHWRIYDFEKADWFKVPPEQLPYYLIGVYGTSYDTLGGGRGIIHSIAEYARSKRQLREIMQRGAQRFAFPFMVVQLNEQMFFGNPDEADEAGFESGAAVARRLATTLQKMSGGQVLVLGNTDKVTPVDFNGQSGQALLAQIQYYDDAMVGSILAATLPVGSGGDAGSFARAQTEQGSVDDNMRLPRQVIETMFSGLPRVFYELNRHNFDAMLGIEIDPPKFRLGQERTDNIVDAQQRLTTARDIGLPVAHKHAYEMLQLEPPSEDDYAEGQVLFMPMPMGGQVDEFGNPIDPYAADPFGGDDVDPLAPTAA